jgi:hypothetical protein
MTAQEFRRVAAAALRERLEPLRELSLVAVFNREAETVCRCPQPFNASW